MAQHLAWFEDLRRRDVARVGGKNSSLGEMVAALAGQGIKVPDGFATTADAYRAFLRHNDLEARIAATLAALAGHRIELAEAGDRIRRMIRDGEWPEDIAGEIRAAYAELCRREGREAVAVAVRSSATAEDLPDASFAGQQETFLNIRGADALLAACRRCFASLFTDRAITYRRLKGFDHDKVALSVGVQRMVRADTGGSVVMFSLDTETGYPDLVMIGRYLDHRARALARSAAQELAALECRAIRRLREDMGFDNVIVMIPFCRTPEEADRVLEVMAANGLKRGEKGLQVYVMCEVPSNVILAEDFARRFDGFSIGSNDLTQLTLGVDRDSEALAALFDERNAAVQWMIRSVIERAHAVGLSYDDHRLPG